MSLFFYLGKVRYLSHRIRDLVINTKTEVLSEILITVYRFPGSRIKTVVYFELGRAVLFSIL